MTRYRKESLARSFLRNAPSALVSTGLGLAGMSRRGRRSSKMPKSAVKSRGLRPYRYTNSRKNYVSKKKTLTYKVNQLKKTVDSSLSTYTKKSRDYGSTLVAAVEQCAYGSQTIHSVSVLQGVIDAVKYFNPSTPGTLINVDLSSPTFQNRVKFSSSYASINARNNYQVPVKVRSYFFVVRKDTGITPETAITNGLADMSNASITNPLVFPTDVHDLTDLWSIASSKTVLLNPGEEFTHSWSAPPFKYDVSLSDSHTSAYQKYFHGCIHVFRIEGVASHGSTSGSTQGKAGIDWILNRNHTVVYPGGSDIKYLEADLTSGSAVGTIQVSLPDIAQETYGL